MQQMQQVLWIDLLGRFKILTHRIIKKKRSLMVLEVLRGCGFPIRESERRHILIKSLPSRPGRTATPEPHENADVAAERLDGDCGGRSFPFLEQRGMAADAACDLYRALLALQKFEYGPNF